MFTTLIVQPIFNLLVLIYALIPGHNFGLSIILFTILVRLLMWPLIKKQLHHARAMRELQPEIKRIKQAAAGNRQQESLLTMELYKEKGINPFASFGILIVQLPILIALYSGIRRIVDNPQALVDFAYPFVRGLGSMKELAGNVAAFDGTLFGVVDLTRAAIDKTGAIYWPAMLIVVGSALAQYIQSKQLMPEAGKARKLRQILSEAGGGKKADQSEVTAAVGRSTRFFIPVLIFIFTVNIASALSLYFLVSGLVAMIQQGKVLNQDKSELSAVADQPPTNIIEGEVVNRPPKRATLRQAQGKKRKKRRR
jgi:YidC/Oxa1 family membrane protein insertase